MKGALLVARTSSDAGKSVITAGLCRWLARRDLKVAPFKAPGTLGRPPGLTLGVVPPDGVSVILG